MPIRRFLAVILIAAILGTGVPAPREARAVETGIIVIASIVAWFGVVILATYFIRNHDSGTGFGQSSVSPLVDGQKFALRPAAPPKVRFGTSCARTPDGPSLLCW